MSLRFGRLVVLSLMSLLAIAAGSGAQAAELTVAPYSTVSASDVGSSHGKLIRFTVGVGARFVECTEDGFSATIPLEGVEELEVKPSFGGCFSNELTAVPATAIVNGCSYRIKFVTTTAAQATLLCPAGKQLEVNVYESAAKHAESKPPICAYDIAEQGPAAGTVTLSQDNVGTATEDITAAINLKEVAITGTVGSKALCGVAAGAKSTATLVGTATASAEVGGAPWGLMTN